MLVTLECLNGLDHRFHALTDGEGKVKAWFSVCEDLALPFDGSFSHMVGNNDFEWRLCFEIYRFAQENAAIMSIPVTFTINGELRRDIQLVLESSKPQSYSILIEDSPLHSEARVSIANLLHDPATSHKATPQPQATLADTNEMWPSELIRDTCTVSPTQTSGNRATSSGTCEAAAHSAEVTPEEDKEHEKFTEEYFHRLLSWTPSISSQSEVAAAGNHPQIKRKAADTPAAQVALRLGDGPQSAAG
ncbi:hypothetical protein GE09DRAFT_1194582 [Coniochaeta sp. 2T2.1]|nr:hypothetical protein GE09DRAFT_1194582 [Coniochaeta sp. 2T2.1]